jgi:hypothetical protein
MSAGVMGLCFVFFDEREAMLAATTSRAMLLWTLDWTKKALWIVKQCRHCWSISGHNALYCANDRYEMVTIGLVALTHDSEVGHIMCELIDTWSVAMNALTCRRSDLCILDFNVGLHRLDFVRLKLERCPNAFTILNAML